MPRALSIPSYAAAQENRFFGQVVARLLADGHAEEAVKEGRVTALALLLAHAPALAVSVEQFDRYLPALTVLK